MLQLDPQNLFILYVEVCTLTTFSYISQTHITPPLTITQDFALIRTETLKVNFVGPPQNFELSKLSMLSLQQFANYSSGFLTLALVPLPWHWFPCWCLSLGLCASLYSLDLPVLGSVVCPVSLPLLQILEEVLIYQTSQLFTCQPSGETSKFHMCRTENWMYPH